MERANFNTPAKDRSASENLIQLRSYILWFLNDPEIVKSLSDERWADLHDSLAMFIRQYNELLAESQRLKSFDRNISRLGAGLAVAKMIR